MRIHLDETLAKASRDDHDPTTVTAETVLAGLASTERRRLRWWLAAGLVLALLVGFLAWYRPRLGPAPVAPTPTPSVPPEYRWDGSDPYTLRFSEEELARRCPRSPGEKIDEASSQLFPGGLVVYYPAGASPMNTETGEMDPRARQCFLGYQVKPSMADVTRREVTDTTMDVTALCSQQTGFDLTDHDWHLVTTARQPATERRPASALVAFVSDSGWVASCQLVEKAPTPMLDLQRISLAEPGDCPELMPNPTDVVETGRSVQIRELSLQAVAPVLDSTKEKVDSRVATVEISAPGLGLRWSLPATDGIVVANTSRRLSAPVTISKSSEPMALTLRMLDARGKEVRRCSPPH
ncbi:MULTISPECIES: hypothetical protein [unclassified Luteococcus]|uniref:hypothetical protein n=1 Tax=unclassified Luteococcus TaxID=2639923 RepID=UPI00313F05AE